MSIELLRDASGREVYRVETPSGVIGYVATQLSDAVLKKIIVKLQRRLARRARRIRAQTKVGSNSRSRRAQSLEVVVSRVGAVLPADPHVDSTLDMKATEQEDLFALATFVTGSESDAVRFMTTPAMGLSGAVPAELARTVKGHQTVREFLLRILYGVYA